MRNKKLIEFIKYLDTGLCKNCYVKIKINDKGYVVGLSIESKMKEFDKFFKDKDEKEE